MKEDTPEPTPVVLLEFKQPCPFIQFQVVQESDRVYPTIFALDREGILWFRLMLPRKGKGWQKDEEAGKVRDENR